MGLAKRTMEIPANDGALTSAAIHYLRQETGASMFTVEPGNDGVAIHYRSRDDREFEWVDGEFQPKS